MAKDKGFYVMHKSITPSIGLQYGMAGNDPGMTLEEAKEYVLDHEDWWVLDKNGKVVFSIHQEDQKKLAYS